MRTLRITVILMAALAGAGAHASAQGRPENERQVTVYLSNAVTVPAQITVQAEALASKMFAGIGVTIHWWRGVPSHPEPGAIIVEFAANTPAEYQPGAWAYALPYEGVHIRVFWDRIEADPFARQLLAHVMAHEITHILQGISRHSADGVMKVRWTDQDRQAMMQNPLRFTPEDVELIHQGMNYRGTHTPKRAGQTVTPMTAKVAAQ
jgi:hypothetical protein